MFMDQNGKDAHSGWNGHQESFLTKPLINTASTDPVQVRLPGDLSSTVLKKCHEQRVGDLSSAYCSAWLSWWGLLSLCPISCSILWLLSYKYCLTDVTFSIIKKNKKGRFKLAICRHITHFLSIPSTQFLVSLLNPSLHFLSAASLLSVHPLLFWINYCVFTT